MRVETHLHVFLEEGREYVHLFIHSLIHIINSTDTRGEPRNVLGIREIAGYRTE